jgi:hypothetical protein
MRSYIKILGPPLLEAIRILEKIALDMPQVCIMDEAILRDIPRSIAKDLGEPMEYAALVNGFFYPRTGVKVERERCNNIISKSGSALGGYDFFFEWFEEPDSEMLKILIEKLDSVISQLGCYYTITTKG